MGLNYQLYGSEDRSTFDELILCADEIERKFSIGRARDIRPDYVQNIINLSVNLRKNSKDSDLLNLLAEIEYFAYATLDNVNKPDYYRYLQYLSAQHENLRAFQ